MKVIVDTSVWSLFLRRHEPAESGSLEVLRRAIKDNNVQMLGIVRQELLSGIRSPSQFKKIGEILKSFPDLLAVADDHTQAAVFFNQCRRKGVQGSPVDFLICAQAHRHRMAILTDDADFSGYAAHLPINLLKP
ncbi:MAG: PIN domain-containing protein [Verrucomicrobiales bacterium]